MTKPSGRVDDGRAILGAVLALAHNLRRASSAADRRGGVGAAGLRVLRQLRDQPAASLTELAERTHTDVSSVSVVVKRLADRGLVDRRQTIADRRRLALGVTERGRAVLRREPPDAEGKRLTGAARRLAGREVRALAVALAGLAAELRRAGVPGKTSAGLAIPKYALSSRHRRTRKSQPGTRTAASRRPGD